MIAIDPRFAERLNRGKGSAIEPINFFIKNGETFRVRHFSQKKRHPERCLKSLWNSFAIGQVWVGADFYIAASGCAAQESTHSPSDCETLA